MISADLKLRAAGISYRQCKLFESVGRLASIRRGSEECNLSQPAVTQALSKLEQHIGDSLLERRASGSYLTDAGKLFHVRVQRMFSQMETALLVFSGENLASAAVLANRLSRSQVRGLIAIIENGSLAKASNDLGLTHASVQRAMRHLESSLRRRIFHRTASGVMVTPDGVELGRRLKLATQEIEWGIHEIDEARGVQTSQLIIGTLPYGGSMLLGSVLDEFMKRHPDARVRVLTESATEMMRRLKFGNVDLVVGIIQETDSELTNEVLAHTNFRIVARKGHPLAGRNRVTLDDLASYDWIIGLDGASRRLCFGELFRGKIQPRTTIETSTLPVIRLLIQGSNRLALMTSYELRHETDALVALKFDRISAKPAVGITMRTDWLPTRIHRAFIDLIKQTLRDQSIVDA